ncbi:glycine/sarcosine/betaine reductase selenoprotein B family protein [Desulfobacterales bacterium HSG16]|nr:glycine/sarcosine/betaine reductase selenoprotein B family protein [Desulfobacterales bacterium HSG16]
MMTEDTSGKETFEEFRKSFFYGARHDPNFKHIKEFSDKDGGDFFQILLQKIAAGFDSGDFSQMKDHVLEWQSKAHSEQKGFEYEDGPFTRPEKPLSESRLSLLTSTGHFIEGQDPEPFGVKNMSQEEAVSRIMEFIKEKPALSAIPKDIPVENLRVRHGGYDIKGVQADPDVALPIRRLRELEQEGIIGQLTENAYSFTGACSQKYLLKKAGPEWANLLKEQSTDVALLVPV